MNLPKDPYMLLSVINMKLRDSYSSLEALCDDMEADCGDLTEVLGKIGYTYDRESNQFSAK